MDILKSAILTACVVGVVSSLIDMAAPEGKLKKQFALILALVLILGIFAPFVSEGFKLDLNSVEDLMESDEYEKLNEDFEQMYIERSSENVEEVISEQIKQRGITIDKIVIESELGEYNSLEIKKVMVYENGVTDMEQQEIKKIIKESLPDSEIIFVKEDSSED